MIKLLKNKLFISMFLLVVCVCITSSCFATELSEQYSQYYVLGGSISSLGVSAYEYDGSSSFSNLKYGYFKVGEKLYCYMFDNDVDTLVHFKQYTHLWLEAFSSVSNYVLVDYDFETNSWVNLRLTNSGIDCTSFLPITIFSETEYNIYLSDGTLVYDYEEIYQETTAKKIVYEITYDENNKTAQVSASIKNGVAGDKLYYSTLGLRVNGKLMNPIEIQSELTAIKVTKNDLIHFQALDSERQYYRYCWCQC